MTDSAAYTASKTAGTGSAHIGRNGMLSLSLQYDAARARTILAGQRSEPPLCVQRAIYCEDALPEMAYVYVASTSGGMLQGDKYAVSFEMGPNAKAHITTQGATRIYGTDRMPREGAHQTLRISLKEHAYLEYMPDQIIPYAGSEFAQDATLSVHETATIVYAETITPGRVGMGESYKYDMCSMNMRATDQDGRFRFVDASRMVPKYDAKNTHASPDIKSFGVMGKYDVVSSLYVITEKKNIAQLQNGIDRIILGCGSGVTGGAVAMMNNTGVLVRLLGKDTESIKMVTDDTVAYARQTVLSAPFTAVRKN